MRLTKSLQRTPAPLRSSRVTGSGDALWLSGVAWDGFNSHSRRREGASAKIECVAPAATELTATQTASPHSCTQQQSAHFLSSPHGVSRERPGYPTTIDNGSRFMHDVDLA